MYIQYVESNNESNLHAHVQCITMTMSDCVHIELHVYGYKPILFGVLLGVPGSFLPGVKIVCFLK